MQPEPDERTTAGACPGCKKDCEFTQRRLGVGYIPISPPLCNSCQAEASVEAEERARLARTRIVDDRRQNLPALMERCGASPWEHGHCSLENFDTSECGEEPLCAAKEFLKSVRAAADYAPLRGLYLYGTTGAGKSHLAAAICKELLLIPNFEPGRIVFDATDVLVSRIRSQYNGKGDVDELLRKRENAKVWILDDLGREAAHSDVIKHLTMLISQRSMRGTLITGNFHPERYEKRHEDLARIGSRLGPAYFRAVEVNGRDRRFTQSAT